MRKLDQDRSLGARMLRTALQVMVPRLGAVCALVPGDFDVVRELFGPRTNYFRAFYSLSRASDSPGSAGAESIPAAGRLRVLLGNSANPSNRHLEALQWLAHYADNDLLVFCPLGYPAMGEYVEEVVRAGKALLGDRFRPLLSMLPLGEYSVLLDDVNVLVFNHRRQQGLFALYHILAQGKVAYLRSESPTYAMLRDFGIAVRDTCSIPGLSFVDFAAPDPAEAIQRYTEHFTMHVSLDASVASFGRLFRFLENKAEATKEGTAKERRR